MFEPLLFGAIIGFTTAWSGTHVMEKPAKFLAIILIINLAAINLVNK